VCALFFKILFFVQGLDNSICTYGGMMSYTTGKPLCPLGSSMDCGALRVLLINSCVSRNTKALVSKVSHFSYSAVARALLFTFSTVARSRYCKKNCSIKIWFFYKVREKRVNLMPKVAASILEAMDRVAREAAETIDKILNRNNNNENENENEEENDNKVLSIRHGHDQGLFIKLEVTK
jgi:mevalonate kinase